jgi:hypothetical protein
VAPAVRLDLRPAAEFQAYHIPNALNLSMADLRVKPYWRTKTVVLMGEGRAYPELFQACAQLKQLGYRQVRVLQGGLPAWVAESRPLSGRAPTAAQLARLTPGELWALAQSDALGVVFDRERIAFQNVLPGTVLNTLTPAAVAAHLRERKARKGPLLLGVVVVADPRIDDAAIEALQQAAAPLPLRVYAGTLEATEARYGVEPHVVAAVWGLESFYGTRRGNVPAQPGCALCRIDALSSNGGASGCRRGWADPAPRLPSPA